MATFASGTGARAGRRRFTAAVVVVTGVLVTGIVAGCTSDKPSVPSPATRRRAASAFIAAWRRSLEGTWAVDEVFERRVGTKRITDEIHEARRPPDHLRIAGGTVAGRLNGRVVACNTGADNQLVCRDGGPSSAYADEVRTELDTLAGYFAGANPLYLAGDAGGGCFELTLQHPILAPPYGESARFCFDKRTGAPTQVEVRNRGSVDTTRATDVRAEPTAADLTLPSGAGS